MAALTVSRCQGWMDTGPGSLMFPGPAIRVRYGAFGLVNSCCLTKTQLVGVVVMSVL